ncbi:NUDIX hydrolase [Roseibium aggregatum]|uniref:NUDIX hydrolase n=1 Tax=Roseibium aggregatum TaxID=187304 RepID=A0A939ECB4_9HYPH|nr:NUDIX hydrolase [Roseibium aggregatum]MBN9670338.1 NUDIX hydrolase [Roseibium aggregatum]
MTIARTVSAQDDSWLRGLGSLFVKPARLQIAALCVRPGKKEPEILLVTTRDTGRLILPKGWPEKDRPAHETALTEAYEEAGVIGKAGTRPMGSFRSFKGLGTGLKLRTTVVVFKVTFKKQLKKYPELGQRKCVWLPLSQAMEAADETALKRFLRDHKSEIR